MISQLVLIGFLAWLILWIEHWFPWQLMIQRELPRPAAYILGVLAMVLPLSGLYIHWLSHPPEIAGAHLAALWAVIISGGVAVLSAYAVDHLLKLSSQVREQQELIEMRNGQK